MDQTLATILLASWIAGLAAFAGGLLARHENFPESEGKREFVHGMVAFGGGILVAAVAFALVPEGLKSLSPASLFTAFCAGGVAFCATDAWLSSHGGSKAQFLAMLVDFIPEALSLGSVFSQNRRLGILLAAFIGAQNLPEGFNSFREVRAAGVKPRDVLKTLVIVSFLGPVAACAGFFILQGSDKLTAGIMSFAAGGILYLVFQDIAPQARMRRHWKPPLGAVLGFAVGMIGKQLIG